MDSLLLKCSASEESIISCGSAFQWRRVSQKNEYIVKCIGLSIWNFQGETVRSGEVVVLSYFDRCVVWQTVYSFNNLN